MDSSESVPTKFSRTEIRQIQSSIGATDAAVACPVCENALTVSHPVDGPRGPCFIVGCKQCNRKAIITDVPGLWQPGPRG